MCEVEQGGSIYRSSALSRYVSSLIVEVSETPTAVFYQYVGASPFFDTQYRLSTLCPSEDTIHFYGSFIPHRGLVLQQSFLSQRSFVRPLLPYLLLPPAGGSGTHYLSAHFKSFSFHLRPCPA